MTSLFKRLIFNSSIYSIGTVFEKGLSFILIPLYTTYLSTEDYGIVGLMSIVVALISYLITPPVTSAFSRHYHSPEYQNIKKVFLFNCIIFIVITATFLSLLFLVFNKNVSKLIFKGIQYNDIVIIYSIITFISPISSFSLTVLRFEEKAKYLVIVSWLKLLTSACFILLGLIFYHLGVYALIYGNLIGHLSAVILCAPFIIKKTKFQISPKILIKPLKYGYSLILQGFSSILIKSGDRFILQYFTTLSTVGVYSFSYNFANVLNTFIIQPIDQALMPILFRQEDDPIQLKSFVVRNCTYFYCLGMIVCLVVALFSKEAIQILARKKEFWEGHIIVPIISFSSLQHGLGNFFNIGNIMTKKTIVISINILIAAAINMLMNIILIPIWGMIGAAIATLVSYFIWNGLKIYYSAKNYDLHFDLKRLLRITIIGILIYLASLFFADNDHFLLNIFIKSGLIALYPVTLLLTGFFTSEEKIATAKVLSSLRYNGIRSTYRKLKQL